MWRKQSCTELKVSVVCLGGHQFQGNVSLDCFKIKPQPPSSDSLNKWCVISKTIICPKLLNCSLSFDWINIPKCLLIIKFLNFKCFLLERLESTHNATCKKQFQNITKRFLISLINLNQMNPKLYMQIMKGLRPKRMQNVHIQEVVVQLNLRSTKKCSSIILLLGAKFDEMI